MIIPINILKKVRKTKSARKTGYGKMKNEHEVLQEHFKFVKDNLFPRWDRSDQWRAEIIVASEGMKGCSLKGRMDKPSKRILISSGLPSNETVVTLIHEICHAVSSPWHGKKWLSRLSVAMNTTFRLGKRDFCQLLENEMLSFSVNTEKVTAKNVYGYVSDYVDDAEQPTIEGCISYLLNELPLLKEEMLRRFPKLRNEYDKQLELKIADRLRREAFNKNR